MDRCSQSAPDALADNRSAAAAAAAGQRANQTPHPSHRVSIADSHVADHGTGNSGWSAPTIRRQPEYRRGAAASSAAGKPVYAVNGAGASWRSGVAAVGVVTCSIAVVVVVTSSSTYSRTTVT